ncbi:OLC1v1010346C1 [Oldenlandia corymbosa var. corymbosa]|uniref:OLC1v1010346C1 n=1 Tax=Oldenlandia corymbosa var. corymbosa TaxID=529605 RepID=A0AAV1DR40_OLDCO|nr:OLC1v1010346C1 [Oldenlandia corymbosa var. corymbosa]
MTTLNRSPACEVVEVKNSKDFKLPKQLYHTISPKPAGGKEKKGAIYEPEYGDLIALTDVRPECIDGLNRYKRPYTLAVIQWLEEEDKTLVPILSSKPIEFEREDCKDERGDKLFAVYLINLMDPLAFSPIIRGLMHCLWILGNSATLINSGSVWKKLVSDAKDRGCFYNARDDYKLAKAISCALLEIDRAGNDPTKCLAGKFAAIRLRNEPRSSPKNYRPVTYMIAILIFSWRDTI